MALNLTKEREDFKITIVIAAAVFVQADVNNH